MLITIWFVLLAAGLIITLVGLYTDKIMFYAAAGILFFLLGVSTATTGVDYTSGTVQTLKTWNETDALNSSVNVTFTYTNVTETLIFIKTERDWTNALGMVLAIFGGALFVHGALQVWGKVEEAKE